jgi:hypothetical protein
LGGWEVPNGIDTQSEGANVLLMRTTLLEGGTWSWGNSFAGFSLGVVEAFGERLTRVGETGGLIWLFFSCGGTRSHGFLKPLSLLMSLPISGRSASRTLSNLVIGRLFLARSVLMLPNLGDLEVCMDLCIGLGVVRDLVGLSLVAKLHIVIPMVGGY